MTLSHEQCPTGTGTADFTICNHSNVEAIIESARTTCGCALVDDVGGAAVGPGKELPLRVAAQIGGIGDRTVAIEVVARCGKRRIDLVAQLTLQGLKILPPAILSAPAVVELVERPGSPSSEQRFNVSTLESAGSRPWLPSQQHLADELEVICALDFEKPWVGEIVERTYLVTARLDPREARHTQWYFVPGTDPPATNSPAPVRIQLRRWQPVRVVPEEFNVTIDADTPFPVKRRLSLFSEDDDYPIAVTAATCDSQWITVERVSPNDSETPSRLLGQFELIITKPEEGPRPAAPIESRVVVQTDHPQLPRIEVLVFLRALNAAAPRDGVSAVETA